MADLSFRVDYEIADALRNLQQLEGSTQKSTSSIERMFRFQIVQKAVKGAMSYAGEAVDLFAKDNERAQQIVSNWDRALTTVKRGIGQDLVEAMSAFTGDVEEALTAVEKLRGGLVDLAATGIKSLFGNDNAAEDVKMIREAEAANARMDRELRGLRKISEENERARKEAERYIETNGDRIRQGVIFDEFARREAELNAEAVRQVRELQRLSKGIGEEARAKLQIDEHIGAVERKLAYDLVLLDAERRKQNDEYEEQEKQKLDEKSRAWERYYDLVSGNEAGLLQMKGNLFAKDAQRLTAELKYQQQIRDVTEDKLLAEGDRARIIDQLVRQRDQELQLISEPATGGPRARGVSVGAASLGSSVSLQQIFGVSSGTSGIVGEQKNTTRAVQEVGKTLTQIRQALSGGAQGLTAVLAE